MGFSDSLYHRPIQRASDHPTNPFLRCAITCSWPDCRERPPRSLAPTRLPSEGTSAGWWEITSLFGIQCSYSTVRPSGMGCPISPCRRPQRVDQSLARSAAHRQLAAPKPPVATLRRPAGTLQGRLFSPLPEDSLSQVVSMIPRHSGCIAARLLLRAQAPKGSPRAASVPRHWRYAADAAGPRRSWPGSS